MEKIGINKKSNYYRHFYYDDEKILMTNPPKYEIRYVDNEDEVEYINVSDVFCIKSVSQSKPVVEKTETDNTKETKIEVKEENEEVVKKKVRNDVVKKDTNTKKKSTKKKDDVVNDLQIDESANNQKFTFGLSYEYKTFFIDFSDYSQLCEILNEYGKEGWDLCGFETLNDGIIISRKKIFCIMKKININKNGKI